MKRLTLAAIAAFVVLSLGAASASAQAVFKVPFKFESGGQKFPAGDYAVTLKDEGTLLFRQESTGKEFPVSFTGRLPQAVPPVEEPQIIFDEVGNFEPSYTEYFTVYVLAQVWLSGAEGYLVHTTKGAHKTQTVKAEAPKK
jgi:hypothetical protein